MSARDFEGGRSSELSPRKACLSRGKQAASTTTSRPSSLRIASDTLSYFLAFRLLDTTEYRNTTSPPITERLAIGPRGWEAGRRKCTWDLVKGAGARFEEHGPTVRWRKWRVKRREEASAQEHSRESTGKGTKEWTHKFRCCGRYVGLQSIRAESCAKETVRVHDRTHADTARQLRNPIDISLAQSH